MEKIDQLRDLLDVHDRDIVTLTTLDGIASVPDDAAGIMRYIRTGDTAVILIGPRHKLEGIYRENKDDGTVTLEFTFPATTPMKGTS